MDERKGREREREKKEKRREEVCGWKDIHTEFARVSRVPVRLARRGQREKMKTGYFSACLDPKEEENPKCPSFWAWVCGRGVSYPVVTAKCISSSSNTREEVDLSKSLLTGKKTPCTAFSGSLYTGKKCGDLLIALHCTHSPLSTLFTMLSVICKIDWFSEKKLQSCAFPLVKRGAGVEKKEEKNEAKKGWNGHHARALASHMPKCLVLKVCRNFYYYYYYITTHYYY